MYSLASLFSIVILMQEGKSNGLGGAIGGMAESYWSKNKGRSMEGALEHFTRYGAIVFMIITLILNIILKVQGIIIRGHKNTLSCIRIEGCFFK